MSDKPTLIDPVKEGLTHDGMIFAYNMALTQNTMLKDRLKRLEKELATAHCSIQDGTVGNLEQVKKGLENLIYFLQSKMYVATEADDNKKAIDIVDEHNRRIKEFFNKSNS